MIVPLIPVSGRRGAFISGIPKLNEYDISINFPETYEKYLSSIYEKTNDNDILIIADVDGLSSKSLNTDLLKSRRIRRRDCRLLTYFENIDDVFDAMCGSFESICIPYHSTPYDVLMEVANVVENSTPFIVCSYNREISTGKSIEEIKRNLTKYGFNSIAVYNTQNETTDYSTIV